MNFHQTAEHAAFLKSIGWTIEEKKVDGHLVRAFIRTLPVVPISLLKIQRVQLNEIDWSWLTLLQQRYRVYETEIEPEGLWLEPPALDATLLTHHFRPGKDYMLTTKTRTVDLTASEDQLLAAMKPKTRYNIHLAAKHGLVVHQWSAREVANQPRLFQQYYRLLQQNARRINMLLLPRKWIFQQLYAFGDRGFVIGVTEADHDEYIAMSLFFTSQTTCSYSHNGSTARGRQLMAPSLVVWAGIKEGKRRGLREFDFDGVYDERYPKRQQRFQGFGRFKAGFGGQEFYFAPMYKQFRWPF